MEGVIFIRTLTQEQERILETFKERKSITANTKAVQGIITEYNRLQDDDIHLRETIAELRKEKCKLQDELQDYHELMQLFGKLQKSAGQ